MDSRSEEKKKKAIFCTNLQLSCRRKTAHLSRRYSNETEEYFRGKSLCDGHEQTVIKSM